MPIEIQLEALHQIPALRDAKIYRPGYAIEYDFFDPTQLNHALESKILRGLFFAGQVNGTTGYEEAGGQGIVAGINAAINCSNGEYFVMHRDESYIGVLIDDLVTCGVDEPYRMFTSRAEYRILLRQDNADERLTEKSYRIGLAKQERFDFWTKKKMSIQRIIEYCKELKVKPERINPLLEELKSAPIHHSCKLSEILSRPEISFNRLTPYLAELRTFLDNIPDRKEEIIESAEIRIKYKGYIDREVIVANKMHRLENIKIKDRFNYDELKEISTEGRQKLKRINPETIGQASRIPGVSPSDINVLLILLKR